MISIDENLKINKIHENNKTIFAIVLFTSNLNAQEISPWLFGQNHWMESRDEGDRPGYLSILWPKVGESGITHGAHRGKWL